MPRSIWSGAISFGLVNVPVRLYPAVREHRLEFHLVHEPDSGPIGYRKVCKLEDREVPDDEIVKAFEVAKGELVFLSDEDFEEARVDGDREIDILDFVPAEEIDPIFFAKTYYLGPGTGAERVYSLLVRALEDAGLLAIGKFVLRQRQHVGALRVRDGVLLLEQMHFGDEILPTDEIAPSRERVGKEELGLARQLIQSRTTSWQPDRYTDTYRDDLRAAIEARRKGGVHHAAGLEEEERPVDLMEALRASIERSKLGRNGDGLEELPKSELEQRARKAGIEGRSRMSKRELAEALRSR